MLIDNQAGASLAVFQIIRVLTPGTWVDTVAHNREPKACEEVPATALSLTAVTVLTYLDSIREIMVAQIRFYFQKQILNIFLRISHLL